MKKILLASTALAGLALTTAPAHANGPFGSDNPIKMEIGGYYTMGYGYLVQDDSQPGQGGYHRRSDGFEQDSVITLSGYTQTDSGWRVGVRYDLRGESEPSSNSSGTGGTDVVKQDWVEFKNDTYGTLQVGDMKDAMIRMGFSAPQIDGTNLVGTYTPGIAFTNSPIATNDTTQTIDSRVTRAFYKTPVYSGFQFGFSYAPDGTKVHSVASSQVGGGATFASTGVGATSEAGKGDGNRDDLSAVLAWNGKAGDIGIQTEVSFAETSIQAHTAASGEHHYTYNTAFNLSYGPWIVGAGFGLTHGLDATSSGIGQGAYGANTNDFISDAGFTYALGAATLGIAWSHGEYEGIFTGSPKAKTDNDNVVGGINYTLAKGVQVFGLIDFTSYSPPSGLTAAQQRSVQPALTTNVNDVVQLGKSYSGTALVIGTELFW